MTRWIRTAGIVAGAVTSAGALATGAFAGDRVSTAPADGTVSSATVKTCGSLVPMSGRIQAAPQTPARHGLCPDAGPDAAGVQVPGYSWKGPGRISTQPSPAQGIHMPRAPKVRAPARPEVPDPAKQGVPEAPDPGKQELPQVPHPPKHGLPQLPDPDKRLPHLPDPAKQGLPISPARLG